MMSAAFMSNMTNNQFRILADNLTVTNLIIDISDNCTGATNFSSVVPTPYNDNSTVPQPEQVIQYYRASTVALTLDGYNNTAVFGDENTPDVPLPSNVDVDLMNCLNDTIGAAVVLMNGFTAFAPLPGLGLIGLAGMVLSLSSL